MPIYNYSCRKCEHTFEAFVQPGDKVECPECRAADLERLLSLPARPVQSAATTCTADPSVPPCGPVCGRYRG